MKQGNKPAKHAGGKKLLDKLFCPESIAIAGVSPQPNNMASLIVKNLVTWEFGGKLYGINPVQGGESHGVKIYPTLAEVPGEVDLLIALSPAPTVPALADQCGAKGTKLMIVETAGFSEYDARGSRLGDELKEKAAANGVRFVGPNCLGVINAENRMCGGFVWLEPFAPGNVSLLSQSGGVGLAIMMGMYEHNMRINKFVSMGNKYDLDEADYLEYLIDDPGTEIIIMFLESIPRGRRFVEVCSRSAKPIIAYKAGVTEAGQRRAASHTASLANDDRVVSAALEEAGVVRVQNLTDLTHYACMFSQPKMRGARLAVVSPAGGFTVIAADECSHAGFTFPPLTKDTIEHVVAKRRAGVIRTENPLDLGDAFASDTIFSAAKYSVMQKNMDAGLVLLQRRPDRYYAGPFSSMFPNIIPDIEKLSGEISKPIVTVMLGQPEIVVDNRGDAKVPVYGSLDVALRAMAAWRDWCGRKQEPVEFKKPAMPRAAREILDGEKSGILLGKKAFDLLGAFGIQSPRCVEADDAATAVKAAAKIGFPVAMKIVSARMSHKTDVGGVKLNIRNKKEAAAAAGELEKIISKHGTDGKILVQKMSSPGLELIVGAMRDPCFGPVVMFGIGGVFVEVLKDVALRLAPVGRESAEQMIGSLSASKLITGTRGMKPAHVPSLAKTIVAVSQLIAACGDVRELDINPVIAYPDGCVAVDARFALAKTKSI